MWLGHRPYQAVLQLQEELMELRKRDAIDDLVLMLEHTPTVTLGRGAHPEHLLVAEAALENLGVSVQVTNRGGDVTLHAPGQLVVYPIIQLRPGQRDVRRYVRNLTEVMRRTVSDYGIDAGTIDGYVGLWADHECPQHWRGQPQAVTPVKLGAIGVRISRWTTMHGFALNLSTNLEWFRLIVPCGIQGLGVGSVESLTGEPLLPQDVAARTHQHLCEVLDLAPGRYSDLSTEEPLESSSFGPRAVQLLQPLG